MLGRILSRVVRSPGLYDVLQWMLGDRSLQNRLAPLLAVIRPGAWMVDVGGGTGVRAAVNARYVCLDLDREKLERFRRITNGGLAIVADASRCPLQSATIDAALCAKVTHHLDAAELSAVFSELARVMRPGGTLILADAVSSERWMARFLWQIDRGSHPRRADEIRRAIPSTFIISRTDTFRVRVFHDFVVYVATRAGSAESAA